jgi:hypothetical protein
MFPPFAPVNVTKATKKAGPAQSVHKFALSAIGGTHFVRAITGRAGARNNKLARQTSARDAKTDVPEQAQVQHNGFGARYQKESGRTLLSYEVDPYDDLTRSIRVTYTLVAGPGTSSGDKP